MPFRLVNLVDAYILSIFIIFKQVSLSSKGIFGNEFAANGDSVVDNKKMIDLLFDIRSLGAHWPD